MDPVQAHQRAKLRLRLRLRCGGGGPLQQVAMADNKPVHRTQNGIQRHQRMLLQLRQMPQGTPDRARQIHGGLAVKMKLGQVIAAG